jgi:hypothetical protein
MPLRLIRDAELLSQWIQPQHLSEYALQEYEQRVQASPLRMIVLPDFLIEAVAHDLSHMFAHESAYRTERGLYTSKGGHRSVDEAEWLSAPDEDRFFSFDVFTSIRPEHVLGKNVFTYLKFLNDFSKKKSFMDFFSRMLGIAVNGVEYSVHSMSRDHFLKIHNDDLRNRRCAFVLYLTPGWQSRHGGRLQLVDSAKNMTSVAPNYNSLVLFDVTLGTRHFVEPIHTSAQDRPRISFGGWLLSG